ncbi:plasmid replication protein RepH [Halorubrum sp. RMP-47]|uniref:plasmid replication protein RepH n=1 Tax=Halorubrum miltondacostae TaxID=3076378 RepID=UPI0035290935
MPTPSQPTAAASQRRAQRREHGVHLVSHPANKIDGPVCTAVSPRLTEWVPDVLAALREHTSEAIQKHTDQTDPWRASSSILDTTLPEWNSLNETWDDATAEAVAYTRAITELALTNTTTDSPYQEHRHTALRDTVESVGTGRGALNADLGALAKGPVALHRELEVTPQAITLVLDGPAWTDLSDRRTGVRALAAIAVLADGFDVRLVASPRLRQALERRYPQWCEIHLGLTECRDRSRHRGHRSAAGSPTTNSTQSAWGALDGLADAPGKRRLLAALNTDTAQTYDELTAHPDLDIERGTVGRYVLDFESRNLATIDRRRAQNTVQLTKLGKTAVSECLTDDAELQHPAQAQLQSGLTATTHEFTSTVSPRREGHPTPADEWIAATGDPEDTDFVQWVPDTDLTLHQRFAVPAHEEGIALVDDQPARFDDGRVTYLSHHAEETLVICQWGGPLATLGRLAAALLSEKALDAILTPSRVGEAFTGIHDGVTEYDPGRTLRRGHQVGWFSHDETSYEAWRERITSVRDAHLARLATLTNSDDTGARSELFEDLHGLLASATHLYHAVGLDLTATIRIPDTEPLAQNAARRSDFCEFLAKTAPKQSVYGIHAGYRLLFEDRPEKLCRRLPYEVDPNTQVDLTMSWVIAGPTATALQDPITTSLTDELTTVREAIADGTETAPTLEIPVIDGTTYPAIRRVIDEIAMTHDAQWTPHERQRLVRLCLRSFGPSDTRRQACPYDVVVSLLRALSESHAPTPADVERAAATLPPTRFRPDLTPTATKLYAALCQADQPRGRSELLERTGISASSYDRRIRDVRQLSRVHPISVDGRRQWIVDDGTYSWWRRHVLTATLSTPLVTYREATTTVRAQQGVMWPAQQNERFIASLGSDSTPANRLHHTVFPVNMRRTQTADATAQTPPHRTIDKHRQSRRTQRVEAANPEPTPVPATPHTPTQAGELQ